MYSGGEAEGQMMSGLERFIPLSPDTEKQHHV